MLTVTVPKILRNWMLRQIATIGQNIILDNLYTKQLVYFSSTLHKAGIVQPYFRNKINK